MMKKNYVTTCKIKIARNRGTVLLVKAQENKEIVCEENPIELAHFLMMQLFGHRVLAQLHASSDAVDNTIDRVFQFLEYKLNVGI